MFSSAPFLPCGLQRCVIRITFPTKPVPLSGREFSWGARNGNIYILRAIGKLAIAGEQAGFSVERMIELLMKA